MAKKSIIARNKKRREMAARQLARRKELRKRSIDPRLAPEEREAARMKLQALPRNGANSRIVNRCTISGRSKAVYKKFMISRIVLRELAHRGEIPGMRKASW